MGPHEAEDSVDARAAHLEARIDSLDATTIAVREFIGASQDLTAAMSRRMNTNVSDMTAVLFLATRGSAGAAELADHLGLTRASVTALVDRLERAGMVERERSTTDRRRVSLTTTPVARIAALTAWMPAIDEIDDVCRNLNQDERDLARTLLGRLTSAMRTHTRTDGESSDKDPSSPHPSR